MMSGAKVNSLPKAPKRKAGVRLVGQPHEPKVEDLPGGWVLGLVTISSRSAHYEFHESIVCQSSQSKNKCKGKTSV